MTSYLHILFNSYVLGLFLHKLVSHCMMVPKKLLLQGGSALLPDLDLVNHGRIFRQSRWLSSDTGYAQASSSDREVALLSPHVAKSGNHPTFRKYDRICLGASIDCQVKVRKWWWRQYNAQCQTLMKEWLAPLMRRRWTWPPSRTSPSSPCAGSPSSSSVSSSSSSSHSAPARTRLDLR